MLLLVEFLQLVLQEMALQLEGLLQERLLQH
jgi:hypothetical protein